ncbi:MAG: DUF938 domain-containing protein [Myxococcota bacterium]
MGDSDAGDARRHAPATGRNTAPILSVLADALPAQGLVLEVASGTGQHAVAFARRFPGLTFQPTDRDPTALASIAAWRADAGVSNLSAPLRLDVAERPWPVERADAVLCINMIHIAPWEAALALLTGARDCLGSAAPLVLYGPYREHGAHTSDSNAAFDASLRERDPAWGVRDQEHVAAEADARGFALERVVPMPANNRALVFRRQSDA